MSSRINLTSDERTILNMYIEQYNQTQTQIEQLQETANNIRENIQRVIIGNTNTRPTTNTNARSNTNIYEYIFTLGEDTSNTNTNTHLSNLLHSFLNTSVIVRPTQEQIENASRLVRYRTIENPLSESCPISLERFENDELVRQIIPCGHLFCQNAFDEWFETNVRCPICRYDIRSYVRPATNPNATINTDVNNTFNNLFFQNRSTSTNTNARNLRDLNTLFTSLLQDLSGNTIGRY